MGNEGSAPQTVMGWDVGGAHLKVARAVNGRIVGVRQIACPLWLGEQHLVRAFREAEGFGETDMHAITMTGELAENFASREEGVRRIVDICTARLTRNIRFYAGERGLISAGDATVHWQDVASANWHATARLAASCGIGGLAVDIGSTTSDIVPMAAEGPVSRGSTDAGRLQAGELIYTGVIRSSLMGLASRVPFGGEWQPLMMENFATAADVYRLTGELDAGDDLYDASDGRGKSSAECEARLARMLGRDRDEASSADWAQLAFFFRERQLQLVQDAVLQVLSRKDIGGTQTVVGAGAGHFLARILANRLAMPYADFGDLTPVAGDELKRLARLCAPAAALAVLASQAQTA